MKVGLMGFEFDSANKGCEALAHSFIETLRRIVDEQLIIYNFTNLSLGIFPDFYNDINFKRIPLKIKDFRFSTFRAMRECDFIFDVTLGDSFSDIYSSEQLKNNLKFKEMAIISKTPYILLPQTYGPFNNRKVRAFSKHVLKKSYVIYTRDTASAEYIKLLAGRDAFDVTDMAFTLPYKKKKRSEGKKIDVGINVSGLLWKGGFHNTNQFNLTVDYQKYILGLISWLKAAENYRVHLIPHVIDLKENAHDDDYKICKELADKYSNVTIPAPFKTPIEAKSYIADMDVFVGARMHSTIGAFSACVPTIPFSYSRKFEGLFESLKYTYVIHGSSMKTEEAIKQTLAWITKRDELKYNAMDSMQTINKKIGDFEMNLKTLLMRKK